jgi:hypothetical protein
MRVAVLPRLNRGVVRVGLVAGLSVGLLVTGVMPGQAADVPGVTVSDPVVGLGADTMSPDHVYGAGDSFRSVAVSPGPKLGALETLLPVLATSPVASAGRAMVSPFDGNEKVVWDRGKQVGTLPTGVGAGQLSGTWFTDGYVKDGYGYEVVRSLGGAEHDTADYIGNDTDYYNNRLTNIFGSLFLVQSYPWVSGATRDVTLSVRDAAKSGQLVGDQRVVPAPAGDGLARTADCLLVADEVDCYWEAASGSTMIVTRTDYLSGTTRTVTLPPPTGVGACDSVWRAPFGQAYTGGVAVLGYSGAVDSQCSGYGAFYYAFNLDNPSQWVQLGARPSAGWGNRLGTTDFDTALGQSVMRVVDLPFGGTSTPHLIGVLGGDKVVTQPAPLRLDLDFSKPVGAGTLTIRNSAGATVGTVSTPATPDGSLRGLTWNPGSAPSGTYTWTLSAKDSLGQATVSNIGDAPASGSCTVQGCRSFTDVPTTHTFYTPICWAAETGVTQGVNGGSTYAPANPVNRGSMAQFLYRLAGSPAWSAPARSPFVDVPTTHQFYKAITWLYDRGITVGVTINGQSYYQPGNAVNRGSMAAFLKRVSGNPAWQAPAASPFADVATAHTFYAPITWLDSKGITQGVMIGGKLSYAPGNPVNRGSMAAFMSRLAKQQLYCATYPKAVDCP